MNTPDTNTSEPVATKDQRPPAADSASQAGAGLSYGQLVRRQFRKNPLAVGALVIVIALFIIASLAPLLANRKPLVLVQDGAVSFPAALDVLQPARVIDILFSVLIVLGAVSVPWWIMRSIGRRVTGRREWPGRLASRWVLLAVAVGATIVCSDGYTRRGIDRTNYRRLTAQPGVRAIMPPVPHHPYANNLGSELNPPDRTHWLGTDETGRDVLSRIIHGTRISLSVGFVAVGLALAIGVTVGALAGFFRGWVDIVVMRFIEVMMCFPTFFLIITIIAFLPRSIFTIMAVIGVTSWMGAARIIRGEFLRLRNQEFVVAADALGARSGRIMFRHMLPNAMAPVLVSATFRVASAILTEAALSFLGFGVAVPTASWGSILREAQRNITSLTSSWWLVLFPGLMVFLTVTAYNLVGEGVRDALDPRLKV